MRGPDDRRAGAAEPEASAAIDAAAGRGCAHALHRPSRVALGCVSAVAAAFIALLVGSFVFTETGPGGMLGSVRVGRPAPDFDLGTLDAGSIRLSDYRGHIVALNFWTTWCPGCVQELPALVDAAERHADAGLVVLAVNAGEPPSQVERFVDDRSVTLQIALDNFREVYRAYHVVGLPTTVWIDGDGIVRAVHLGALTAGDIDGYVREVGESAATARADGTPAAPAPSAKGKPR